MDVPVIYRDVVEFLARTDPERVIAFRASDEVMARVKVLMQRSEEDALSEEEKQELGQFLQLEHMMRLAKARARQLVSES